jgi:hypothetical protein
MWSKTMVAAAVAIVLTASLFAEDGQRDGEGPEAFSMIVGPRMGVSGTVDAPSDFSDRVSSIYPAGSYFPVVTLFGITVEQRILLGRTRSHFAFQEVILVGGLEQGIALPEGALLIGYRDYSGFEIGAGPILHLAGIGVVVAAGFTFSFSGMFIPLDLSVIIPTMNRPASVALTTGFNFQISRREPGPQKSPKAENPEAPPAPAAAPAPSGE